MHMGLQYLQGAKRGTQIGSQSPIGANEVGIGVRAPEEADDDVMEIVGEEPVSEGEVDDSETDSVAFCKEDEDELPGCNGVCRERCRCGVRRRGGRA